MLVRIFLIVKENDEMIMTKVNKKMIPTEVNLSLMKLWGAAAGQAALIFPSRVENTPVEDQIRLTREIAERAPRDSKI
jgi:hypothetical protein